MPKFAPFALLLMANLALAQPQADTPLQRTEAMLEAVREEQRAVYQQFQMIQSLQQGELQNTDPVYVPQGQIPNYDDMARARQEQQVRLRNYSSELQQLHTRYRDLGAEAAQLLERMRALSQPGAR